MKNRITTLGLFIAVLAFASISKCQAQAYTLPNNFYIAQSDDNFAKEIFRKTSITTHIAMSFAPNIPDSVDFDWKLWIKESLPISKFDYYVMNFKPEKDTPLIEVRTIIKGKKTDYTFKQFRKLIYE